ncbi:nitroreductase family protein [Saccharicrinis sp. FJH62]|uniref:nitroreductase family protein n=1 Tax=Saccharicrinis sp. FJH62 TaxID=3344657 RepID=UPI0035D44B29
MNLRELLLRTRSYRRFDESYRIPEAELEALVELTRLAPSARNQQVLRYIIVSDKKTCDAIFPNTAWAGYLKNWNGPVKGERPSAYILVLKVRDLTSNLYCDDGLAIQTIMLGASEKGLGGCIIGSFSKQALLEMFNPGENYEALYLIALGKPIETVVIDEIQNGDIKYWRDDKHVHHVPKRPLKELILTKNDTP